MVLVDYNNLQFIINLSATLTIPELVFSTNSLVPPLFVHNAGSPHAIASTKVLDLDQPKIDEHKYSSSIPTR